MYFNVVGDTGFEPVHHGIKIRCLSNLANPLQTILIFKERYYKKQSPDFLGLGLCIETLLCYTSTHKPHLLTNYQFSQKDLRPMSMVDIVLMLIYV